MYLRHYVEGDLDQRRCERPSRGVLYLDLFEVSADGTHVFAYPPADEQSGGTSG